MKQAISLAFIAVLFSMSVHAQVGIGTTTPNPSAELDVTSQTRGFLPPRLALVAANNPLPVTTPATGLLVYNTATAGTALNAVKPGYYFWDSVRWQPVVNTAGNFGDMQYWDGTQWIIIPIGTDGQALTICNGIPKWGGCNTTVTLLPMERQFDGFISSSNTIYNYSDQILVEAWTQNGSQVNTRGLLKMNYNSIPLTATIESATLYLYSDLTPQNGPGTNVAQYGPSNECYVRRITNDWSTYDMYNWTNQPATTSVNQVTIPASISPVEDYSLDVTGLVQDQLTGGNNGFMIQLQNESIYKARQFASSRNADVARTPKLVITYH